MFKFAAKRGGEEIGFPINRSIVINRVDEVKTAYSGKTLPLHPMLASALCEQRNRSLWTGPGDWIFANPQSGGTYQPWKYAAKKMKEAAIKAGLGALAGILSGTATPRCCAISRWT